MRLIMKLPDAIRKRWFLFALAAVCAMTLIDTSGTIAGMGKWIKSHGGADAVIFLIFLASGLVLKAEQIKRGIQDLKGTALALIIMFIVSPLVAYSSTLFPLPEGVRIGLFLVAVMPTTLSSGVVMTVAAGGNMAHALLITLLANGLSVFTVPLSLGLLLGIGGQGGAVPIEKGKMMIQIAFLVLVPLLIGLMAKPKRSRLVSSLQKGVPVFNQCLILGIVWMGLSEARDTVLSGGAQIVLVLVLAFCFHAILLSAGFLSIRLFHIPRGRMESILFMGGQKTLPLAVLLQVKLFPQFGLALVFCVFHHFIHLIMDGYLVGRLNSVRRSS
jgi:solute carrier family 10 (sodium/bile acid cotransporter), member 7